MLRLLPKVESGIVEPHISPRPRSCDNKVGVFVPLAWQKSPLAVNEIEWYMYMHAQLGSRISHENCEKAGDCVEVVFLICGW